MEVLKPLRLRRYACALLLSTVCGVCAQEVKQEWTVVAKHPEIPTTTVGVFDNQHRAIEAMAQIAGPSDAQYAYGLATHVKETKTNEDQTVTLTYWLGNDQPSDPEWSYSALGSSYATEVEMVAGIESFYTQFNECGKVSLKPATEWTPYSAEFEGRFDSKSFDVVSNVIYDDGTCLPVKHTGFGTRQRRLFCPLYTTWNDDYQACVNLEIFAYLTGPSLEDTCSVGNPCDVKTGEKSQPEQDFDLGWIRLVRTFRSSQVGRRSNLGAGWFNSHEVSVSASGSYAILAEGNGLQRNFKSVGNSFIASDGSGDRLEKIANGWRLFRSDTVSEFDATGALSLVSKDDGTYLRYTYDRSSRLESITHSTGRKLVFNYADGSRYAQLIRVALDGVALATYAYSETFPDSAVLESVTYADGRVRSYLYEDEDFYRFLTGVVAEDGMRYSTFVYNATGRVVSSQHHDGADGVTLDYTDGATVVTDALGKQTTYTLSQRSAGPRKIDDITDSAGTLSSDYLDASVDFRRRLRASTDRAGVVTQHAYAEVADAGVPINVHTVTEAAGLPSQRITSTRTTVDSNRLISVQSSDKKIGYVRNARLQPQQVITTDVASGQTRVLSMNYCEAADVAAGSDCPVLGLLKSIDGPRTDIDDRTTYNYYPIDAAGCETGTGPCPYRKGDLKQTINARGQIRENLSYDAAGRVLSAIDENGVLTDYSYHPRGWLASTTVHGATSAQNRVTTLEYWPTGLVKRITQPDGSYARFVYDQAQRLTDVTDTLGNTLHYVLDNAGNRLEEQAKDAQGALKRSLSRIYNQLGQLKTQADAAANPTDYAYDANGNLRLITDAFGRSTLQEHDPLGRLARTLQDVDGIKAETNVGYDTQDRPLQVKDAKRLDTRYTYNGFGDTLKLTSPDTGVTSYTYDSAGNRATQTDARGITSTYGYDALNRVLSISYPTTAFNVSYTYDVTQSVCASGETFTVGRLAKLQDGSGTTQYCYNRFGEVVRKVQTVNGKVLVVRYDYTPSGRLRSMVYPDGTTVDYVRNAQGQTTEVGVTAQGGSRQRLLSEATYYPFGPSAGWTYGNGRKLARMYDQDYRPQSIQDSHTGGLEIGFGFDPVGDLTDLTPAGNPTPELQLTYDALGRLTALKDGSTGTVIDGYSYDGTGNRVSAKVGGATQVYTYPTTNHRLSAVAGVARTYDKMGNTLTIGGKAREYLYDNTGRMTQVKRAGVAVMNYRYNGQGEQVRRYLGTTNTYTLYDEAGHWLGDYDTNGAPKQQAIWLDDLPVGLLANGGQLHYIEPDHLGSPRVVVDADRDVAVWNWSLKGEAFGNTAPNQDPDGDGTAMVVDMRFPGQRYDAASGFNQNYFRDYDAATGRYGQSDPIGIASDISTYLYASANPYEMLDLLGLESVGSFNNGGHRLSWEDGVNLRGPDFVKVSFNYGPGTLSFTRGRNGRVYMSKGMAKIYPHSISAGISASMGWVNECEGRPNDAQLNNLFTGPGLAGFGAYGPLGGAYGYSPGAGSTTEIGVGTGVSITKGRGTGGFGGEKGEVISNDGWGWEW
ncbi:RHS repeat-associated core domain-containing protein [Xanthomonas euroxanthea]|uniref:RHS repeat-associated core domain-containing protein n=1 Tax=Xanthomonas euroxanthea TaxID=2259622 RepID=UPI001E4A51A7|nr:RHS repeat-associated core domain-containing protein [Xanthomonas euroxanthea]